ncbi:LytTR family transcriptional regulator DNA-binding domain-containing protein [Odoribacter sp. OttesenSCG-928-J03]|nr:LytTR family transcriptional regulator DNA-binding domain-containing protein [Odoribacter sp. OttesenSCG-928-J03]
MISLQRKLIGIVASLLMAAVLTGLLVLYANTTVVVSIISGLLYSAVLLGVGYCYWYIQSFLQAFQAKIVVAIAVQVISVGVTFSVLSICGLEEEHFFIRTVLLFSVYGVLCWNMLVQWYTLISRETPEEPEQPIVIQSEPSHSLEAIDRISVKDGTEISIVYVDKLHYIQAYGDYVILYADSGKYVKEQTMKYFEQNLPAYFVRIHRSHIVNTNMIAGVELFGKESYNIRLRNGSSLKASATGYKLLKERLGL